MKCSSLLPSWASIQSVYHVTKIEKKILKLVSLFYIKSFWYGISHSFISVLESLCNPCRQEIAVLLKQNRKDMHDSSALSLQKWQYSRFSWDPYMLRGRISFPFNLNLPRTSIAFNFSSIKEIRFSFSLIVYIQIIFLFIFSLWH